MADEKTGTEAEESNNSEESTTEESETAEKAGEGEGEKGTTEETADKGGEKKEFEDPNMQAAFTKKMQELSEEKKKFDSERDSFTKEKELIDRKLGILQKLDSDPEIVSFVKKRWGVAEAEARKASFTNDELVEALNEPDKMADLIMKEVDRRVEEKILPATRKVENMEFTRDIDDYADSQGNEDFFDLYKLGLIKPYISTIKAENPKMSGIELIKEAHLKARELINTIRDKEGKSLEEKKKKIIEEKKAASADRGSRVSLPAGTSFKGKSITEVGLEISKKM